MQNNVKYELSEMEDDGVIVMISMLVGNDMQI
jgi:hypothetical protein